MSTGHLRDTNRKLPHALTHKPHKKPAVAPYKPCIVCQEKPKKDDLKSSAWHLEKKARENLTLHDWMTVFQFVNEHPFMSQQAIMKYFEPKVYGALIFTQATLSQKLKPQMQCRGWSWRTHNKTGNGTLPTDGEPLHQAWIIWWLSGPSKISSAIPNPS